jgi:hypothetical protein
MRMSQNKHQARCSLTVHRHRDAHRISDRLADFVDQTQWIGSVRFGLQMLHGVCEPTREQSHLMGFQVPGMFHTVPIDAKVAHGTSRKPFVAEYVCSLCRATVEAQL